MFPEPSAFTIPVIAPTTGSVSVTVKPVIVAPVKLTLVAPVKSTAPVYTVNCLMLPHQQFRIQQVLLVCL